MRWDDCSDSSFLLRTWISLDIFFLLFYFLFSLFLELTLAFQRAFDHWLTDSLIGSFLFIGSLKKQIILLVIFSFVNCHFLIKVLQLWSKCLSSAANLRLEQRDRLLLQLLRDRSNHWVKMSSFYQRQLLFLKQNKGKQIYNFTFYLFYFFFLF